MNTSMISVILAAAGSKKRENQKDENDHVKKGLIIPSTDRETTYTENLINRILDLLLIAVFIGFPIVILFKNIWP